MVVVEKGRGERGEEREERAKGGEGRVERGGEAYHCFVRPFYISQMLLDGLVVMG